MPGSCQTVMLYVPPPSEKITSTARPPVTTASPTPKVIGASYAERIAFPAAYVLTPLLNRRAFIRELRRVATFAQRYGSKASLVYFDLDGFKSVNDRFGHAAGDELLITTTRRIRDTLRESDLVCRVSGDEFLALLSCPDGGEQVRLAADRVVAAVRQPLALPSATEPVRVGASVGVASAILGAMAVYALTGEAGARALEAIGPRAEVAVRDCGDVALLAGAESAIAAAAAAAAAGDSGPNTRGASDRERACTPPPALARAAAALPMAAATAYAPTATTDHAGPRSTNVKVRSITASATKAQSTATTNPVLASSAASLVMVTASPVGAAPSAAGRPRPVPPCPPPEAARW